MVMGDDSCSRLWVRIPALNAGWTFFTLICCKNCIVCLKRPKINEKEAGVGPFQKRLLNLIFENTLLFIIDLKMPQALAKI